jgi:hypothetical protein
VLTLWDSLEAIRRFAGANLENAVVEPAAQAALVTYDSAVTHHTVVVYMVGADPRTSELVTVAELIREWARVRRCAWPPRRGDRPAPVAVPVHRWADITIGPSDRPQ